MDPQSGNLATDSYNLSSPAATEGPLPKASANQPPMRHRPPNGVTGPRNLKRAGSSTRAYMLPENMVMPAVKNPAAMGLSRATSRAMEWMIYSSTQASECSQRRDFLQDREVRPGTGRRCSSSRSWLGLRFVVSGRGRRRLRGRRRRRRTARRRASSWWMWCWSSCCCVVPRAAVRSGAWSRRGWAFGQDEMRLLRTGRWL